MRKFAYVLAAIVGFAGTNALLRPSSPRSMVDLTSAGGRGGTSIWFVFDALSCRLTPEVVRRLNAMAVGKDTVLLGVMVDGPTDQATFARVTDAFGMRFRVIADSGDSWQRAAHSADMPMPLVVVRKRGRLIGLMSLLNYQIMPDSIVDALHTLR